MDETILQKISDNINFKIDFDKLNDISNQWGELLISYQRISDISTEKIDVIFNGIRERIKKLKRRIK